MHGSSNVDNAGLSRPIGLISLDVISRRYLCQQWRSYIEKVSGGSMNRSL